VAFAGGQAQQDLEFNDANWQEGVDLAFVSVHARLVAP